MNPETATALSPDVRARARREREFFNLYSDPAQIPDEVLRVPRLLDAIPDELYHWFPSLEGKSVCEIGCGYGVLCAWFALRGARVFGFDVSDSNVLVARRTARVNRVAPRVFLQVMQGECLGFADNSFDLVFGNAVLHHLDRAASAREVYRVLKPGGVAIFREPLGENRLLEWVRNCPLRSANHRHSQDERPFVYEDLNALRAVFPQVVLRESELFTVLRGLLRSNVGMISVLRFEPAMQKLARVDRWLLSHFPPLRGWASYSVISLFKPPAGAP
jgi:SAM-dependent methyltransferase